jgi:galactonate dehydratase
MEECASMLIGLDPFRIDNLWQRMMRGYFYPAGREKLHSLGALDLALWDLKGKALDVPVWQLLGGKSRNHVELYSTVFPHRAVAPWRTWRKPAATPASAPIATLPTTRESA